MSSPLSDSPLSVSSSQDSARSTSPKQINSESEGQVSQVAGDILAREEKVPLPQAHKITLGLSDSTAVKIGAVTQQKVSSPEERISHFKVLCQEAIQKKDKGEFK